MVRIVDGNRIVGGVAEEELNDVNDDYRDDYDESGRTLYDLYGLSGEKVVEEEVKRRTPSTRCRRWTSRSCSTSER
jgi:hypothetical protein